MAVNLRDVLPIAVRRPLIVVPPLVQRRWSVVVLSVDHKRVKRCVVGRCLPQERDAFLLLAPLLPEDEPTTHRLLRPFA